MPYAYQQNGAAKHTMHIILDRARSAMAKSGMALKYWTNAISTIIYV